MEGEEEPVVWVCDQHEADEDSMMDEEPDPALVLANDAQIRELGLRVRQRLVDFLQIVHAEEDV